MILSLPTYEIGLGTGSSEAALPGTGFSAPTGVDGVLEYNGLYLNIRDWVDTYLVFNIDGLADADVRDARELNPGQHGETPFDPFYGGRTIVITGRIRSFSLHKMRDMQQALRRAFSDLKEIPLIFHSGDVRTSFQINCRKVQPIVMAEVQTNYKFERDFQVTLRASNPRFTSILPSNTVFTGLTGEQTRVIVNEGNFSAQPTITLTGPLTDAVITNDTNAQSIILSGVINAGTRIVIDVENRRMYDADTGTNAFGLLANNSDWMELVAGENSITVDAASYTTTSAFSIDHKHTIM